MKKEYNDAIIPENFEEIAKAYSQSLKKRGFIFVRLEEEEFSLLLSEVFVIISKMNACLKKMETQVNSEILKCRLETAEEMLREKFGNKKKYCFDYVGNTNDAFLCLIGLENLVIIKLMLLSIKSGELELCNHIITSLCNVFSESFSLEGFKNH